MSVRITSRFEWPTIVARWIGQGYELKVLLEDELPKVSVWMTADPKAIQVGTTVTFYVAATDNVGVQELSLAVGGTPVALQPAGFGHVEQGSLKMDVLGAIPLLAKATDTSGQEAQYSVDLNVVEHVDVGVRWWRYVADRSGSDHGPHRRYRDR